MSDDTETDDKTKLTVKQLNHHNDRCEVILPQLRQPRFGQFESRNKRLRGKPFPNPAVEEEVRRFFTSLKVGFQNK